MENISKAEKKEAPHKFLGGQLLPSIWPDEDTPTDILMGYTHLTNQLFWCFLKSCRAMEVYLTYQIWLTCFLTRRGHVAVALNEVQRKEKV